MCIILHTQECKFFIIPYSGEFEISTSEIFTPYREDKKFLFRQTQPSENYTHIYTYVCAALVAIYIPRQGLTTQAPSHHMHRWCTHTRWWKSRAGHAKLPPLQVWQRLLNYVPPWVRYTTWLILCGYRLYSRLRPVGSTLCHTLGGSGFRLHWLWVE